MSTDAIYQLKVTLLGSRPPIWRRLLMSSGATLQQLHLAIQISMGWTDSHLHEFTIDGEPYGSPDPFGEDFGGPKPQSERRTKLSSVMGWKGAKARYTYDFGDGWEHDIVVEKVLPPSTVLELPLCTAGKRRCPPEDCGGIPGYYDLLEALGDPAHPEHDNFIEWLGGPIDPEEFSIDVANDELGFMRKKSRGRRAQKDKPTSTIA